MFLPDKYTYKISDIKKHIELLLEVVDVNITIEQLML